MFLFGYLFKLQIRLWDLSRKECLRSVQAHESYIRGTVFLPDGDHFLTIGDDKTIKMWETDPSDESNVEPTDTVFSKVSFEIILQQI